MGRPTISPSTAILVNTNIMLGTGVFINTTKLAHATGMLSPIVYVCVGALLYPLIHVFMRLQATQPRGSLYDFGALLHPHLGFLSAWGYYVGKLASAYLGIHVFTHIITQLIPWLVAVPTELTLIAACVWLYQQRVEVATSVQYTFMACKVIPLLLVTIVGLWWISGAHIDITLPNVWYHFPATIPFVLFSFAGFEASCALSQSLPHPERDAPRVIIISYALAVAVSALYQASSWVLLGNRLAQSSTYLEAFVDILTTSVPTWITPFLNAVALSAIAISAIGASYSIIFSNTWNLYTLASRGYIWFSKTLTSMNQHNMPARCGLVTGSILLSYLIWSYGDTGPLQQVGAVGATWAYVISTIAWFTYEHPRTISTYAALLSCSIFIYATVQSGITFGLPAYMLFIGMLLLGHMMTWTHGKTDT